MAFTATSLYKTVMGDKRVTGFTVLADANSGSVDTGLSNIEAISVAIYSCATNTQKFKANINSGGTAANGMLFMSSCASGDQFYVTAVGR